MKDNAALQHKTLNIFRKGTLHLGKGAEAKEQRRSPGSEQKGQCSFAAQNAEHLPQRYLAFGKRC
jgi:hypothetical protein